MASKRRPPDMDAIRKSRASFTGAITKARNKLTDMKKTELATYNAKAIERLLTSLSTTEAGFQQTLEDAQDLPVDDEAPLDETDEMYASEAFSDAITEARDLAEEMLQLKSIHTGLEDFKCDLQALRDNFSLQPELDHDTAYKALDYTFSSLRKEWRKVNAPSTHQLKTDLDICSKALYMMAAEVTTSKARLAPSLTSLSTSMSSKDEDLDEHCRLPKIDVPTFNGDIMEWATFWNQFEATIDSNGRLSDTSKLVYLRRAIKDPDSKNLGVEKPGMHREIVATLKERFEKHREVHRNLCEKLVHIGSAKPTRDSLWT